MGPDNVVWGQHTAVWEEYDRNFAVNWTGTGTTGGTPGNDDETLELVLGDNMISETWNLGVGTAAIRKDIYDTGSGPDPTIEYKTGSDALDCEADTWHAYIDTFTSEGYVKIRLSY